MANEIDKQIAENTAGPRKASGDSGSVEQHALQDQIAAKWADVDNPRENQQSLRRVIRSGSSFQSGANELLGRDRSSLT